MRTDSLRADTTTWARELPNADPDDEDLQQIQRHAVKAGILERPIAMKDLIDRQFISVGHNLRNIDPGP